jgi:hypothetical protein
MEHSALAEFDADATGRGGSRLLGTSATREVEERPLETFVI